MDEAGFRTLVESSPDGVLIHARGVITYASPRLVRILRTRAATDLVGRPVMEFIHPDDRAGVVARQSSLKLGPAPPGTFRLLGFDGSVVPVETTASLVEFQGTPSVLVMVRDVSMREERLITETHLRVTRELVRRMLKLVGERGAQPGIRRELGRALALEADAETERDLLWAFTGLGIGRLRLASREGDRFVFEGEDLLDVDLGGSQPSCQLALGFSEGMVERVAGASALGTEMQCQGQGHPACRFVVKARPKPA